ncbi:MAG: hypothetical protein ABSC05_13430 [Candidatus Solibacter sp.]|jgi:hypothetical protein
MRDETGSPTAAVAAVVLPNTPPMLASAITDKHLRRTDAKKPWPQNRS